MYLGTYYRINYNFSFSKKLLEKIPKREILKDSALGRRQNPRFRYGQSMVISGESEGQRSFFFFFFLLCTFFCMYRTYLNTLDRYLGNMQY